MNWAPLILAVVFAHASGCHAAARESAARWSRSSALSPRCAFSPGCRRSWPESGIRSHPGPILLGIIAAALASATFFYFDVIRGHHKDPLKLGRKAIGGGGAAGAPGGGKSGHHARALVASVGLAVFGLMIAMNWGAVAAGVGGGFSQTVTTITHAKGPDHGPRRALLDAGRGLVQGRSSPAPACPRSPGAARTRT